MAQNANEDAKNLALLFFMDHLMAKSGQRTIHDLSCQFGSRGFTPEMREAVGGTQEGLAEFLGQFPSLFKLEGDNVSLAYGDSILFGNALGPMDNIASKDRDYDREAVEFFIKKLEKFGPEVQIKSLLGHRSQAAAEIRYASGRHVREFAEFLQHHTEAFVVEGDRVRLKNLPQPAEPIVVDESGQPLNGVKAKQFAVDYLKSLLEGVEAPMPMEIVYKNFCDKFQHSTRQEIATNPKELLAFLKCNRSIFFIRSNKVSLVRQRPDGGQDQSTPSLNSEESSINGDTESEKSSSPFTPITIEDIEVCKSAKMAASAIAEILQSAQAICSVEAKFVTLNREFLSLLILGTIDGKLYVFDVAASTTVLMDSGLKELLESENWIKVMLHDSIKRLQNTLKDQYSIIMRGVFDTKIANAAIQHRQSQKALDVLLQERISLLTLQRFYFTDSIKFANRSLHLLNTKDVKFWLTRPLTEEMLLGAVEECSLLVPWIYEKMRSQLPGDFFEYVLKLSNGVDFGTIQFPVVEKLEKFHETPSPAASRKIVEISNGHASASPENRRHNFSKYESFNKANGNKKFAEIGVQTISTGDIVIKNYYKNEQ